MEPKDLLQGIVDRALKVAQEAEAFWVHHQDEPVRFEANRLKQIDQRESSGVALRIIKDGRVGLSSTTNLQDIQGLVDSALEMAPLGPEARFQFPTGQTYHKVEVYDPKTAALSVDEMVQVGQTLIDGVRAFDQELLCDARVDRGIATVCLLNSRGAYVTYTQTSFSVSIESTLVKDTDMLFIWEGKSSCSPILDVSPLVASLGEKLEHARTVVPAPVGEVPVIFTPHGVAGALITPLLSGFNGKAVLQGASPLVGKLGQELLDEKVSVRDDPSVPLIPGSRMCDDEGVPTAKLPLVHNGIISLFLYDLQTAGQAGTTSTGSAHRSLNSLPSPGVSVLVVDAGDVTIEDMVEDMKDGLVVEGLLGAGQSNILGGDFNANVLLGFRVEKGRIVGRVKNTLVSGNVYKVLKDVAGVGRKAEWVSGSMKLPPLYCKGVSVATKE